ncbi:MAG: NAD(P)-binding domain-containing protein [Bacteroidetes bacterium]|nr:NAD(P)-binding domain-containing protein [Bacteroidota bacterium]
MEVTLENLISYGFVFLMITVIMFFYLRKNKKQTKVSQKKIEKAKELGFHEPVSLHPVVSLSTCIGSSACITACPEKDIIGIVHGKAVTINASRCVGHGACFHACPLGAITLVIGTEKRGVELPHISPDFETSVKGIYIAGELGGMGLIKNAVEQGRQAVENITRKLVHSIKPDYDLVIVGAGPAGISASLTSKQKNIKFLTLEQDTLGGTVYSFPRAKIVMTSPMYLPLYGKVKLVETSKTELLSLWHEVLNKNDIAVRESEKVVSINPCQDYFAIQTNQRAITSSNVLLAIGRRGSPRKLGVPGENKEKVMYRLLEPELINNKDVLVVGGGDSAIESALLLADEKNRVTLSYRGESFSRIKPGNYEKIKKASEERIVNLVFNSNVKEIKDKSIILSTQKNGSATEEEMKNDLVYVFAGGELPNKFLEQIGITITKKFGEAILKH